MTDCGVRGPTATLRSVHEIHAGFDATVRQIIGEEGQLVAEDDEIVILEVAGNVLPVVTEVPGVLRELHVALDDVVRQGDLIALIDES